MKLGMMGFQSGIGRPFFCTKSVSIMVKWEVPFTVFFFAEYLQKYIVFYCLFVLTNVLILFYAFDTDSGGVYRTLTQLVGLNNLTL